MDCQKKSDVEDVMNNETEYWKRNVEYKTNRLIEMLRTNENNMNDTLYTEFSQLDNNIFKEVLNYGFFEIHGTRKHDKKVFEAWFVIEDVIECIQTIADLNNNSMKNDVTTSPQSCSELEIITIIRHAYENIHATHF